MFNFNNTFDDYLEYIYKGKYYAVTKDYDIWNLGKNEACCTSVDMFVMEYIHNIFRSHREFSVEDFERLEELQEIQNSVMKKSWNGYTQGAIDAAYNDDRNLSYTDDLVDQLEARGWLLRDPPEIEVDGVNCRCLTIFTLQCTEESGYDFATVKGCFDYLDSEPQTVYIHLWNNVYDVREIQDSKSTYIERVIDIATSPKTIGDIIIKAIEDSF